MLKLLALFGLLFLLPSLAHAAKCPVINGHFARIVERDGRLIRQNRFQYTRVESGVYSYSLGKKLQFQLADGNPRQVESKDGTIAFSCTDRSLEIVSMEYGSKIPYRVKMTPIGDEILVEETNVLRSGIYKRAD